MDTKLEQDVAGAQADSKPEEPQESPEQAQTRLRCGGGHQLPARLCSDLRLVTVAQTARARQCTHCDVVRSIVDRFWDSHAACWALHMPTARLTAVQLLLPPLPRRCFCCCRCQTHLTQR